MLPILVLLMMLLPNILHGAQNDDEVKELGLVILCDTTKLPGKVILDVRDGPQPAYYKDGRPILDQYGQPVQTNGQFRAPDGARFRAILKACLDKHRAITRIDFTSGGGDVEAAFEIAQAIAEYRFHTHVPAGSRCVSACTLAFLGGMRRTIDPQGTYEVHGFTRYGGGGSQYACGLLAHILDLNVNQLPESAQRKFQSEIKVLVPHLQQIQQDIKQLAREKEAISFFCLWLGENLTGELMEIERSSALLSRRWMQTVQQRRVSSKLLDHIFSTTTAGVRPLTRQELEELAVITDDGQ